MSADLKQWLTDNGIRSESSTPFEPWQNGRAEVQIRVLCNLARTNMIASGLTGKFWARTYSMQLIFWIFSIEQIFKCLLMNLCSGPNQMSANASHLESNAGCMCEKNNDRIVSLMLVANQLYTVVAPRWITDPAMFFTCPIERALPLLPPTM